MKGDVVEISPYDHYRKCDMGRMEGGPMQTLPHLKSEEIRN
jgi:hypothetical protein